MIIKNKTTAGIVLPDKHFLPPKGTYTVNSLDTINYWKENDRSFARHLNDKTIEVELPMVVKKETKNVKSDVESQRK